MQTWAAAGKQTCLFLALCNWRDECMYWIAVIHQKYLWLVLLSYDDESVFVADGVLWVSGDQEMIKLVFCLSCESRFCDRHCASQNSDSYGGILLDDVSLHASPDPLLIYIHTVSNMWGCFLKKRNDNQYTSPHPNILGKLCKHLVIQLACLLKKFTMRVK